MFDDNMEYGGSDDGCHGENYRKFVVTCLCISETDLLRHIVRAATLRQKLQIKLALSATNSILISGQPVPGLTL